MQVTTTTPLFTATLRPDRSLRTTGGWIGLVLAGIVAAPLLIAMPAFVLPALIAFGLAASGLVAFGIRQGRRERQSQQITLWTDQLEITSSAHGRARQMMRFSPNGVRLRLVRDQFERTTALFLSHGEGELELGGFLSRDDKSSFAKAFGQALRQARRAA